MFSAENVLTLFEICDDFKIDSKINPINMVFDYISKNNIHCDISKSNYVNFMGEN